MNLQHGERQILARDISFGKTDGVPARTSIGAKLRAILRDSIDRVLGPWPAASQQAPEEPIRSELFSIERLEQHAQSLAVAQATTSKPTTDRRLELRLRD